MGQKFNGEVGQVAGRDVKNSGAQASVNIYLHNGARSKQYISERQRRAIGAKVFELEAKTGVEKLIVYRRLIARFKFPNMDEMPCDLFKRVMRYLDGWIRNGTADQMAPLPDQPEVKELIPTPPPQVSPKIERIALAISAAMLKQSGPTPVQHQKKPFPWFAVSLAVIVTIAVVVVLYVVVHRPNASTQSQTANTLFYCEYGGNRYTVGSLVLQEGLRQRCEVTAERTAVWQPLTSSGRH